MSKRKSPVTKTCVECSSEFTINGERHRQVTCSSACSRQRHLRRQRTWAAGKYVPASAHEPISCGECGCVFVPYTPAQTRFCSRVCQSASQSRRRNDEVRADRVCGRCGGPAPRQPGPPVCAECKTDKRNRKSYERLRTLRRYGLTEASYRALMESQSGRCGICKTADWGPKGPSIDHCHDTGKVRWLLCMNCNTGIGMFKHDPALLRRAADRIDEHLGRSTPTPSALP